MLTTQSFCLLYYIGTEVAATVNCLTSTPKMSVLKDFSDFEQMKRRLFVAAALMSIMDDDSGNEILLACF